MSSTYLVALLLVSECAVEMSWVLSEAFNAVVGPLERNREGGLVAKEFSVQPIGGGAPVGRKGGRTAPSQTEIFDSTSPEPIK